MESYYRIFLSFWITMISSFLVNAVEIKLYSNYNYTGLILASGNTRKCINLPANAEVRSFTTDTCMISFNHFNCESINSWKSKAGNHSASPGTKFMLKSVLVCNDDEGGSQLNVDITNHYGEDDPSNVPSILERYTRVCTCINVPDYIKKLDKWSINNHNNDFMVYYEPDCSENKFYKTRFLSGHHEILRNVFNWTHTDSRTKIKHKVQSFAPDKDSQYFKSSCRDFVLLTQLTRKIEILEQNSRQTDLKIKASQTDISSAQIARSTDMGELRGKHRELSSKIDSVKSTLDSQNEKTNLLWSQLTRKIETLEQNSRQTDLNLRAVQRDNSSVHIARSKEIVELGGKIRQFELRFNASQNEKNEINLKRINETLQLKTQIYHVERSMDDKIEKLIEEVKYIVGKKQ